MNIASESQVESLLVHTDDLIPSSLEKKLEQAIQETNKRLEAKEHTNNEEASFYTPKTPSYIPSNEEPLSMSSPQRTRYLKIMKSKSRCLHLRHRLLQACQCFPNSIAADIFFRKTAQDVDSR